MDTWTHGQTLMMSSRVHVNVHNTKIFFSVTVYLVDWMSQYIVTSPCSLNTQHQPPVLGLTTTNSWSLYTNKIKHGLSVCVWLAGTIYASKACQRFRAKIVRKSVQFNLPPKNGASKICQLFRTIIVIKEFSF